MRLEDGDIALRAYTEDDVPALVAACQDPEIPRWTSVPSPYIEEDARRFVAGLEGHHAFAVVDAETDELLGSVGFDLEEHGRAEFGYWVAREARGRGVASRALLLLARWAAREHGLARLQLIVDPANAASIRVAEKAGFEREGLLRSYIELNGTRRDVYLYSLLPEELLS
ncbi:MAG: GNAT family N-acetyltransferase [Gaiellaceae bacterium]